jgi:CheY-like chemotaxis protein
VLVPFGLDVQEAASGTECLDIVRARRPDAVLLDVNMDGMDGWQTCEHLRDAGYVDLPVIMVSANVFHDQAQLASSGCNGFVSKPVAEADLLAQLETHLQLQWIYEEPPVPVRVDAVPSEHTLSNESVAELIWLARIGDLASLRRGIARIEAGDAATRAECTYLRSLADRVDLEGILRWLQRERA